MSKSNQHVVTLMTEILIRVSFPPLSEQRDKT